MTKKHTSCRHTRPNLRGGVAGAQDGAPARGDRRASGITRCCKIRVRPAPASGLIIGDKNTHRSSPRLHQAGGTRSPGPHTPSGSSGARRGSGPIARPRFARSPLWATSNPTSPKIGTSIGERSSHSSPRADAIRFLGQRASGRGDILRGTRCHHACVPVLTNNGAIAPAPHNPVPASTTNHPPAP